MLEPGAFYVMDRGYLDFGRLYLMHQTLAFFVTRAKSNTQFRRVYSAPVDRSTGIICDQTIVLTGTISRKVYPVNLRRIRFKDPETGKTLVFLTNNFTVTAPPSARFTRRAGRWSCSSSGSSSICLPAHKKACVREYAASTNGRLTFHFLPGYAPDLNPDEFVWSHVKRTGTARRPLRKGENLQERIDEQLDGIQKNPKLVRSFFGTPSVAYIGDC